MKLLNATEAKFVEAKLQGKNNKAAAMFAGIPESSAKQRGYELIRRPQVREALGITLDQLGITFEAAVKPIKDGLTAMKVHSSLTEPDSEVPDHAIRLSAAKLALQLLKEESAAITEKPNVAQYQLTEEQMNALQGMDEVELQRAIFRKADGTFTAATEGKE